MAALVVSLTGENGVTISKQISHFLCSRLDGMRYGIFETVDFDPFYLQRPGRLQHYGLRILELARVHIYARNLPSIEVYKIIFFRVVGMEACIFQRYHLPY
jgi:hypothetical protein